MIRILWYLEKVPGHGILYSNHGHGWVEGFSNADWAGSPVDRQSMNGYCTFVGGNLVSWKSKKQAVVAWSSAESEYRAMGYTICELMWVKRFLTELDFTFDSSFVVWLSSYYSHFFQSCVSWQDETRWDRLSFCAREVAVGVDLFYTCSQGRTTGWFVYEAIEWCEGLVHQVTSWAWLIYMLQLEGVC